MLSWARRLRTLQIHSSLSVTAVRYITCTATVRARRIPGKGERKSKRPWELEDLGEFKFDDQTTVGHELYDNIREVRSYLKKSKFELPKLEQFAQVFTPPDQNRILCFKSHDYLGESHPAAKKVILSVKVANLKLEGAERKKFLLLCGPRYNPTKDEVIFSCEKFPHRAQNKKFLSDLLERVLEESKDESDIYDDIPLDTRHVKAKKKLEFPKDWLNSSTVSSAVSSAVSSVVSSAEDNGYQDNKLEGDGQDNELKGDGHGDAIDTPTLPQ